MNSRAIRFGRFFRLILPTVLLIGSCTDFLDSDGSSGPKIVSSHPRGGELGVSVFSNVKIRFSMDLDSGTVTDGVGLFAGDRPINVRTRLESERVVLMEATDPLDFGSDYRVTVSPALRSMSGKSFSDQKSWDFRTEGTYPPQLNRDSLEGVLGSLSHDTMAGRGSGTPDEVRSAEFLRERMETYGLQGPPGGMVQPFQAYSPRLARTISSQNVMGIVPGAGSLAEEWILAGAHYDHLGLRYHEDGTTGIHNGADDNASGTALILELARVYRSFVDAGGIPVPDRRSVIFVAFGAEELGLLGSCHYAQTAPAVPLGQTRAMLNFDMVGRLRDEILSIRGFESSPAWSLMASNANEPDLLLYETTPCRRCSDFACFWAEEIPFLNFSTGMHPEYHTPSDDIDLINLSGLAQVGQVALRILTRLVVMEHAPPQQG